MRVSIPIWSDYLFGFVSGFVGVGLCVSIPIWSDYLFDNNYTDELQG